MKNRLVIDDFSIDLAASKDNKVTFHHYNEISDALHPDRGWNPIPNRWAWCNPPYANIEPWVRKALDESEKGAHIIMLVPASVGSNWWYNWVDPCAYAAHLNGRLTFVGETAPYPKDCALLLYTPWGFRGSEIWNWRGHVPQLQQRESSEDKGLPSVLDVSLETGL